MLLRNVFGRNRHLRTECEGFTKRKWGVWGGDTVSPSSEPAETNLGASPEGQSCVVNKPNTRRSTPPILCITGDKAGDTVHKGHLQCLFMSFMHTVHRVIHSYAHIYTCFSSKYQYCGQQYPQTDLETCLVHIPEQGK